ncbi:MAG: hypothetical protein KC503_06880 [Myxococcales bacterium]|nr:hypothetical protein [Myxococcales bacterium]
MFALASDGLPEECPECGTDLPDESFVVAVPEPFSDEGTLDDLEVATQRGRGVQDLDRTDKLPAMSVIHETGTDELDPTRIDHSVQSADGRSAALDFATLSDAKIDRLNTPPSPPPLATHPTVTGEAPRRAGEAQRGNGASRGRVPLATGSPLSHQQDFPTYGGDIDDTGQMSAFDDSTYAQPTMDLDALAAAVPDKDATPSSTPQTWACPACGAEWTAVDASFCPACDWKNENV